MGGQTAAGGSTTTATGGAAGTTTATGGAGNTAGTGTGGSAGSSGAGGAKVTMCPAQTSMAVLPAGTAPEQAAGTPVASTATRPQLEKADVDAVHTILEALKRGGDFSVQQTMGGAAGSTGAGGASGGAGGASSGGAGGASAGTSGGGASSSGTSGGGAAGSGTSGGGAAGTPSGGTAGLNAAPPAAGGGAGGAAGGGAAGKASSGGTAGGGGAAAGSAGASSGTAGTSAGAAGASAGASGAAAGGGSGVARGTLVYAKNDNWDPLTNGIGDVNTFVPTFTVGPGGTHEKLQAAIDEAVFLADCPRVYIRMLAGTYRGPVKIPSKTSAPPITIYSTESDPSKTVIANNYSASGSPTGEVIAAGISASATFTQFSVSGFQAKNITIANDYVEGTVAGDDQSALALLNQGDRAQFENVRILANRYTLFVKSTSANIVARSYFRDSYIEGDENIVAGRGTAVFDHCEIHTLGNRVPTGTIIAVPSTALTNPHGLLFISSKFTADAGTSGVLLGRQWFEGKQPESVGKIVIRNSTIGDHINKASPWGFDGDRITPKDAVATKPVYSSDDYFPAGQAWKPSEAFLGESGNTGPGASP